jgi:tetratricopeptide (TPR) repeat protein
MGSLLYTYGQFDKALAMLEKARTLSPSKQAILSKISDVYIAQKNYKDAYDIAKMSYELEPAYDTARMTYAVAATMHGDKDIASKILTDRYGTDLIFNQALMTAYENTDQIDKLIAIQKQRIIEKPDDIQPLISLAAGYLKIGQREKSIETLEEAAQKHPDYKSRVATWIEQIRAGQNPH